MKRVKCLAFIVVFLVFIFVPVKHAKAASDAIGSVERFNNLKNEEKYLGEPYRDNYYLDMERFEISDIATDFGGSILCLLNQIANILFLFERWLSYATVVIFYVSFNLNLSDLFGTQLNSIQQALNDSIFQPLFLIGCAAAFCILIGRMMKQDLAGTIGQIVKIVFIVMVSILVGTKSDVMLSKCNDITKQISLEILTGVNSATGNSTNVDEFAASAAGILWRNLVHEPWKSMEFGSSQIKEGEIDTILSLDENSEARIELIESDEEKRFSFKVGGERLGFTFFYLIPCAVKCIIYILVAFVQLFFQLMSILYTFMAPLVLIISLFPGYEGIMGGWLRKIFESQISILIISLIIGVLIKFDELIFDWAKTINLGWFVALIVQIAIAAALYLNRNNLLNTLSNVQRGVSNPAYMKNRLRMGGNVYQAVPEAVKKTGGFIHSAGEKVASLNRPVNWTVNPFIIQKRRAEEKAKAEQEREKTNTSATKNKAENPGDATHRAPRTNQAAIKEAGDGKAPVNSGAAVNGQKNERSDSIKELADEISKNINQLASVIESAEDALREEGKKGKTGTDEVKRPMLMKDKHEGKEKQSTTGKEIIVHVKGVEAKEEKKHSDPSKAADVKELRSQGKKEMEQAKADRPKIVSIRTPDAKPESQPESREKTQQQPQSQKGQRLSVTEPVGQAFSQSKLKKQVNTSELVAEKKYRESVAHNAGEREKFITKG